MNWNDHIQKLLGFLQGVSCRDADANELSVNEGFIKWRDIARDLRDKKGTVYLVGNGASASMASHFAADLAKNAHLHTQVFSDLSLITAISNDLGFDQVFAEPLRRRAKSGDMLVTISSSGNSENILKAMDVAKQCDVTIVTLSAMNDENPSRSLGNLNFYVPAQSYGDAESCHASILHFWMDSI